MEYQINSSSSFNNVSPYECWKTMTGVSDEELQTNGLRKGPWIDEEDTKLTSAIEIHGAVRWNTLANLAGLKRSGKSCRLRWLNYLRPGLRRGTFTLKEQLLILELHFLWGNRWSKIAENLPGRTDNEIKNYWRTKVQKLARQLHCHVNSAEFRNALRQIWIPRLIDQIHVDACPTSAKAKSDAKDNQRGLGLMGSSSSSSTSSETYCLFDADTSWAQNSLDHHVVGPIDLAKAQSDAQDNQHGFGLMGSSSSSSTSSETCCLFDADISWAQNTLDHNVVGPIDLAKAQSDAQDNQHGFGLMDSSSSSSTSSEICYLFDTHTSRAQNTLDQHVVEPIDLCSKPSTFTDAWPAHISPQSSSSAELDTKCEQINNYLGDMTVNDEDYMLFFQPFDYLA